MFVHVLAMTGVEKTTVVISSLKLLQGAESPSHVPSTALSISEEMLRLPSLSITHLQSPDTPSAILANAGITDSKVAPINEIILFIPISLL